MSKQMSHPSMDCCSNGRGSVNWRITTLQLCFASAQMHPTHFNDDRN